MVTTSGDLDAQETPNCRLELSTGRGAAGHHGTHAELHSEVPSMSPGNRVASLFRRVGIAVTLGALALTAFAPMALASHLGATVDCGSTGIFTIKATETGNGSWQAPGPGSILLFEEGGTLKPLELWVDGNLRFSTAVTGREHNALTEVQCTFTIGTGQFFWVEGIFTGR
jgi:hypothetical protein